MDNLQAVGHGHAHAGGSGSWARGGSNGAQQSVVAGEDGEEPETLERPTGARASGDPPLCASGQPSDGNLFVDRSHRAHQQPIQSPLRSTAVPRLVPFWLGSARRAVDAHRRGGRGGCARMGGGAAGGTAQSG